MLYVNNPSDVGKIAPPTTAVANATRRIMNAHDALLDATRRLIETNGRLLGHHPEVATNLKEQEAFSDLERLHQALTRLEETVVVISDVIARTEQL